MSSNIQDLSNQALKTINASTDMNCLVSFLRLTQKAITAPNTQELLAILDEIHQKLSIINGSVVEESAVNPNPSPNPLTTILQETIELLQTEDPTESPNNSITDIATDISNQIKTQLSKIIPDYESQFTNPPPNIQKNLNKIAELDHSSTPQITLAVTDNIETANNHPELLTAMLWKMFQLQNLTYFPTLLDILATAAANSHDFSIHQIAHIIYAISHLSDPEDSEQKTQIIRIIDTLIRKLRPPQTTINPDSQETINKNTALLKTALNLAPIQEMNRNRYLTKLDSLFPTKSSKQ